MVSPLDHFWFRQYASGSGRWATPDPLGGSVLNPQSLNRYAYVLNDPMNFIDPLGGSLSAPSIFWQTLVDSPTGAAVA